LTKANETQVLEQIAGSTVRIFAGDGSLGSGSCFEKSANELLILTNAHVAGRKGASVKVEFWYQGRLSRKIPGVVVKSFLNDRSDHDYAVVSIKREDLGGYFDVLEPIALADHKFVPDFTKLYSAGCPLGTWQTHWIGHGTENLGDQAVKFVPMPANGRSGSAIYQILDGGKIVQIGVITYRTKSPGKDGSSETDGEGIAQTIGHIRRHLDGTELDESKYMDLIDVRSFEQVPTQDCPGGTCKPDTPSVLISGPVDRYSLRYIDLNAERNSHPNNSPSTIEREAGKLYTKPTQQSDLDIFPSLPKQLENCPDGTCPKPEPKIEPLPQELEPRRELFPNLPKPEILPAPSEDILRRLAQPLIDLRNGQEVLRDRQQQDSGILGGLSERFDRRMDLVERQLEIQRQQLQHSIKEGVENVEKGIVGRILDLPLIRQVRWLVRVMFWPLVLFAIWWVPAFLLNLGPLWFLPIIRATKGFISAAFAGLKEIFTKKQVSPPSENELAAMIADILKKQKENE
jgi:hypothetical protein